MGKPRRTKQPPEPVLWYKLDENNKPVPGDKSSVLKLMKSVRRQVAHDVVSVAPSVVVSTVFLYVDYGLVWGKPLDPAYRATLWETAVFGGRLDGEYRRYQSHAEAEAGHAEILARVREAEHIFEHERAIEWEH